MVRFCWCVLFAPVQLPRLAKVTAVTRESQLPLRSVSLRVDCGDVAPRSPIRRTHFNIPHSSGELIERRVYRIGAHATHVLVARVGPSGKKCLESSGLAGRRQPTTSHGSRGRGAAHINIDD